MNLLDKLGGRRFILAILCHLSLAALKWAGKLDDGGFVTALLGTTAAYITGNVAQRHIEAKRDFAEKVQGPAA
jgi:hypothetical protein